MPEMCLQTNHTDSDNIYSLHNKVNDQHELRPYVQVHLNKFIRHWIDGFLLNVSQNHPN